MAYIIGDDIKNSKRSKFYKESSVETVILSGSKKIVYIAL